MQTTTNTANANCSVIQNVGIDNLGTINCGLDVEQEARVICDLFIMSPEDEDEFESVEIDYAHIEKQESVSVEQISYQKTMEPVNPVNPTNGENKDPINEEKIVIKSCPNCNLQTVKDTGCNRIKCPVCSTQWCYVCGKVSGSNTKKIRKNFKDKCTNERHTSRNYPIN